MTSTTVVRKCAQKKENDVYVHSWDEIVIYNISGVWSCLVAEIQSVILRRPKLQIQMSIGSIDSICSADSDQPFILIPE